MNESIPSRAHPPHAAQKPRTWFLVRGVFANNPNPTALAVCAASASLRWGCLDANAPRRKGAKQNQPQLTLLRLRAGLRRARLSARPNRIELAIGKHLVQLRQVALNHLIQL